jgi:hypothetical protein
MIVVMFWWNNKTISQVMNQQLQPEIVSIKGGEIYPSQCPIENYKATNLRHEMESYDR